MAISALKRTIQEHPNLTINLNYTKMTDSNLHILLKNNSNDLCEELLSVNLALSCNYFTESILPIVNNKLSPHTLLSLLGGNFIPHNMEFVEKFRNENLEKAETAEAIKKLKETTISDSTV